MNEKNITELFIHLFGKVFNEDIILTDLCVTQYEYLIEKYKLNEKEKQILYYILNVQYPKTETKHGNFHLVITMYNEVKISRCIELLLSLSKNLQNNNIQTIHIIYETIKNNDNINLITETLYILQSQLKLNIIVKYLYERPSFRYLFKYSNEFIKEKTILSNTDIIYDDTLEKIADLKDDDFLCISRHNKRVENNIIFWEPIVLTIPDHLPQNIQNSFSHDTWIFRSPMKYPVYIDMTIGKMFCDSYLNYKLSLTPYKCYNLANDIHCYHIQEDSSFSDIVSNSPDLIEEYMDELKYKENGKTEVLYALIVQNIADFYNKKKFNTFYSHTAFVEKYILSEQPNGTIEKEKEKEEQSTDDVYVERYQLEYSSDDNSFLYNFEESDIDSDNEY